MRHCSIGRHRKHTIFIVLIYDNTTTYRDICSSHTCSQHSAKMKIGHMSNLSSAAPSLLGSRWTPISHTITSSRYKRLYIVAAKKKGGGKKGNKKKTAPLEPAARPKPYLSTPVIMQNLLMVESFFRKTGR